MEPAAAQVTPARDPAAAMEEDEDNKSAPQSPRSASASAGDKQVSPPPPPTTTMQNIPSDRQQASQQHPQQQHYYPAPNGLPPPPPPQHQHQQHPQQQLAGSPSGAASMSLPSIQHFEGQGNMQSQHQQYMPAGQMNGAPMYPPPYNPGIVHYQQATPTMPSNAPAGQNGMMRYAIPQNPMDARAMSGGRHKKEIKRRTKTGCLTCRKRRIKCDEGHPTCRNCQKSKRECLGYDPIFKQSPNPAMIQPAPTSTTPPVKVESNGPSEPYHLHYENGNAFAPHSQRDDGPPSPHDTAYSYQHSVDPSLGHETSPPNTTLEKSQAARQSTIEHLYNIDNIPPPLPSSSPEPGSLMSEDIKDYYLRYCAPGLNRLFETWWYTLRGVDRLMADSRLPRLCVQAMEARKQATQSIPQGQITEAITYPIGSSAPSLEAYLVWQLALMPRSIVSRDHPDPHEVDHMVRELLPRIDTVEALLSGQYLSVQQIPPLVSSDKAAEDNGLKATEISFWHHLGLFTSLQNGPPDPTAAHHVQAELVAMRSILAMLENRDVLYSIAVARNVNSQARNVQQPKLNLDEEADKLRVAQDFVHTEERRGTSQVIQRICSMASRSWSLEQHAPR